MACFWPTPPSFPPSIFSKGGVREDGWGEAGRWEMGDGRWEMGDGRWEMGDEGVVIFHL